MCSAENLKNALFKYAQLFEWTCHKCWNQDVDTSAFCHGIIPTGMMHSFYIFCLFRMHSEMLILETAAAKGRPLVSFSLLPFWLWQGDGSCTTALELTEQLWVCVDTCTSKIRTPVCHCLASSVLVNLPAAKRNKKLGVGGIRRSNWFICLIIDPLGVRQWFSQTQVFVSTNVSLFFVCVFALSLLNCYSFQTAGGNSPEGGGWEQPFCFQSCRSSISLKPPLWISVTASFHPQSLK